MLREIRDLIDDHDAHTEELRRRWGGLRRYRYIDRLYAPMDPPAFDDDVVLRMHSCQLLDGDRPERVLARIEGQGVSIGTPPEGLQKMEVDAIEVVDSPELPPLWQVFGAHRRPDGHWALPELSAKAASPDATVHIGPQFVVLETAAADAVAAVAGTDRLQGTSSHVMFTARGEVGPFRADTEAVAGAGDTVAVRVLLHEGNGDRPITSASYVFASVR